MTDGARDPALVLRNYGDIFQARETSRGWKKSNSPAMQKQAENDYGPVRSQLQTVHPSSNKSIKAAGTRLRRRLSKIFQCANQENGFSHAIPQPWAPRARK